MYPEDRVLVGVINRQRDLDKVRYEHWYRVPQSRIPKGVHAEYIAFFLSRAFKDMNGGIHYYARRTGVELVRRRDLLPDEDIHSRADCVYYKLQLGELRRKDPPVLNPSKRAIAFIYTTWDRFENAREIADLYSDDDQFVDRVFHALERSGVAAERIWQAERGGDGGAQIRVKCEDGNVIASTAARDEQIVRLDAGDSADAVRAGVDAILDAIRQRGGRLTKPLPLVE